MTGGGTMFQLLCFAAILFLGGCSASDEGPVVEMPLGKVRGVNMTSRSGQTFMAFLGMPYAKPPVGSLRFQPPEPAPLWRGIKEAKEDGPYCLQYDFLRAANPIVGTEDCLYLNVYTKSITGKTPVLVHFHGGAFVVGHSSGLQPHYLMDEDVVVVHVHYRLGIFGFLSFESDELPGNQGMKDQVMSLQWVKQNIASFGGDPNKVTIIGESAGAASVAHHIVSPLSKGLFHHAIAESGTSYAPWAVAPPGFGRAKAEKLMKLVGCPTNPQEAVPCIMEKDSTEIVSQLKNFVEWQIDPLQTFGPVLESAGPTSFLVGPISEWKPSPVPLLTGITSAEGLFRTLMMLMDPSAFKEYTENFDRLAPMSIMYGPGSSNPDDITKEIRRFYFSNKKQISMDDFNNLTLVYSDSWFIVPAMDEANKHTGKVYFYYFDYISKNAIPMLPEMAQLKKYMTGADHVAEARYIWKFLLPNIADYELDKDDTELSKKLVKIIANFMTKGTPGLIGSDLEWKTWTPESHNYVHIDNNGFHLKQGLAEDRYKFWKSINYRDNFDKNIK